MRNKRHSVRHRLTDSHTFFPRVDPKLPTVLTVWTVCAVRLCCYFFQLSLFSLCSMCCAENQSLSAHRGGGCFLFDWIELCFVVCRQQRFLGDVPLMEQSFQVVTKTSCQHFSAALARDRLVAPCLVVDSRSTAITLLVLYIFAPEARLTRHAFATTAVASVGWRRHSWVRNLSFKWIDVETQIQRACESVHVHSPWP